MSGMGTPDLQGHVRRVHALHRCDPNWKARAVSGGIIERVHAARRREAADRITGPPNALLEGESERDGADLEVLVDPQNPVALAAASATAALLLQQGEWSDWAVGATRPRCRNVSTVSGMVRFDPKQVRPHLMLYMSPVNIDPREPAQTIATPAEYARELTEAAGPFYTEEMPEDTKALRAGVLDPHEFLTQSQLVLDERETPARVGAAPLRRGA